MSTWSNTLNFCLPVFTYLPKQNNFIHPMFLAKTADITRIARNNTRLTHLSERRFNKTSEIVQGLCPRGQTHWISAFLYLPDYQNKIILFTPMFLAKTADITRIARNNTRLTHLSERRFNKTSEIVQCLCPVVKHTEFLPSCIYLIIKTKYFYSPLCFLPKLLILPGLPGTPRV